MFTALLLTIAVPLAARASVRSVSDDALARASAAAVEGRVVAIAARWDADADAIYTYVTIEVARSWGLAGSPARVVVKQLGGLVADTALVVGGQAQFDLGEDVLIFLDVRPRDGTLSVSGLEQGKWTLSGGDSATAANRQTRGQDPSIVVAREYRSAAYLNGLASLAGTQVSAAGAVLEPVVPPAPPAGGRGPAFTYLTSTPARWHQADTSAPVYVDSETGGHPQFVAGGLPQLENALAAWSAAGSLRLQRGADRGPRCFSNSEYDGHISIAYNDPCGEISNASSVLAIGGVYYSASDVRTVNGTAFWKIVKGMVVVDDNSAKYASFTTGCYEDMLIHEIGHAIGFGHTSARPAIMAPSLSSSCFGRSAGLALQSDDLAAVAAVYPGTGQPVPPPPSTAAAPGTPTGLAASVVGGTVTITWNAPTTGGTATGYQLYAGLAPGTSSFGPFPSPTTGLQATGVGSGVYYVRVVATNASGASAATADLAVYVGMSAPPAAPMNLTATASPGGVVALAWQPPMSGTVTSYRLLAGHAPGANTYEIPVVGNSLSAAGVPSGTYYLRVVALNGASASPSCTEVTLVVP